MRKVAEKKTTANAQKSLFRYLRELDASVPLADLIEPAAEPDVADDA